MRYILITLTSLIVFSVFFFGFTNLFTKKTITQSTQPTTNTAEKDKKKDLTITSVVAENLEVPWGLAFLNNGNLLVTERKGTVRLIENGKLLPESIYKVNIKQSGESGLHGITLHPKFSENNYVYLYYTYSEKSNNSLNRVSRFTFIKNTLISEKVIVDKIPGAIFHDGGRIKFGPDGYLYITTGDAQNPSLSQDKNSLAGKILRITDDGKPAPNNPFNNEIYTYGHRNPQGITWDNQNQLWETEHGPSGGTQGTGNDELNKIEMGKNYGWPVIFGDKTQSGMETPIINSTPQATWAPAGAVYYKGSIYFAALRGTALYQYIINSKQLKTHFKGEFGRIRDVVLGPDNFLYITTSNRDGRGVPNSDDDKIIKINPELL